MALSHCSCSLASQLLPLHRPRPNPSFLAFPSSSLRRSFFGPRRPILLTVASARRIDENGGKNTGEAAKSEEDTVEVEEDLPWIQEKALDLVEFTGSVSQTLPGPRVGNSSLPWILALPLAYAGVTFVIAFVRTFKKFTSPKAKRKRLVSKNATLLKAVDELLLKGRDVLTPEALKTLVENTGFSIDEILRKYIRYALNEKPFNPDSVADLIQLRKASGLDDSQVDEVLIEVSRRIVQNKGPVVMNMSGYTERGFKRKLAVQSLFAKVFYLSELPEFCSKDNALVIKEIFGVSDEDAEQIRINTLSEAGDMDSLERMVDDGSDSEEPTEAASSDQNLGPK